MTETTIARLFKEQVKPVLGCTEPSAIALAVSTAFKTLEKKADALPQDIKKIVLALDKNVFRNAFSVGIPRTDGSYGIKIAAAVGVFCDPALGLKLFSSFDRINLPLARKIAKKIKIKVLPLNDIYIKAGIFTESDSASVVIENTHTGIALIKFNKKKIFNNPVRKENLFSKEMKKNAAAGLSEIIAAAKKIKSPERKLIGDLIAINRRAAEYGMKKKCGLSVGQLLERISGQKTIIGYTQSMTAAACDARMGGEDVEIMAVCGSGNQGIMCSVPIAAVAKKLKIPQKKVIEAVAISVLVECKLTYFQGYLTSMCGAITKAGLAASAGLTYLLGGDVDRIENAMKIFAADITGVICDGAKPSCSLKLATSASSALKSALFSLRGMTIGGTQGIIKNKLVSTLKNIADINRK